MPDTYTPEQIARELERELRMRESVYPGWIDAGRVSRDQAEVQIGIMRQLLAEYRAKISPDLFDDAATLAPLHPDVRAFGEALLEGLREDLENWRSLPEVSRPPADEIDGVKVLKALVEQALAR